MIFRFWTTYSWHAHRDAKAKQMATSFCYRIGGEKVPDVVDESAPQVTLLTAPNDIGEVGTGNDSVFDVLPDAPTAPSVVVNP